MITVFVVLCLTVYAMTQSIEPKGLFEPVAGSFFDRRCRKCGQLQERVTGLIHQVNTWENDGPIIDPDCECQKYVVK